jgi:hypothetical protein
MNRAEYFDIKALLLTLSMVSFDQSVHINSALQQHIKPIFPLLFFSRG